MKVPRRQQQHEACSGGSPVPAVPLTAAHSQTVKPVGQPNWRLSSLVGARTPSLQVAVLRGHPVFKVTETQVLADSNSRQWKAHDHRCAPQAWARPLFPPFFSLGAQGCRLACAKTGRSQPQGLYSPVAPSACASGRCAPSLVQPAVATIHR